MWKPLKLAPWFVAAGVSWSLGYLYNVYYGGELSWLRAMYQHKMALAAEVKASRRLLIIGGSGVHHSLNCEVLEQQLGIPVLNLGLDGPVGLNVIFPSVLEAVRPGDIVLLIPEDLIILDEDGFLERSVPFGVATGRPGLGGVPPKLFAQDFWSLGVPSLRALTKSTVDIIEKGKVSGYYDQPLTKHGDPDEVKYRKNKWHPLKMRKPITPHAIARITQFREELKAKGATLLFSLPWVYASTDEASLANMKKTAQELGKIAPIVYDKKSFNLKTDINLFADTHHHLLLEVRKIRSRELAAQLKPVLEPILEKNSN